MAFISRKIFTREIRYSTVEKEALAIKWALDSLKYYLLGREFTLATRRSSGWRNEGYEWTNHQMVPCDAAIPFYHSAYCRQEQLHSGLSLSLFQLNAEGGECGGDDNDD